MSGTLGIPTMAYLPFAFFNIAAPLMSLVLGFTGFKIERIQPGDAKTATAPTV
jgi:NhaC family Na+:H+ antiporter